MNMERRLGMVRITGELVQEMFLVKSEEDWWWRVQSGIPADAKFIRMAIDVSGGRSELCLVYEHESFPNHYKDSPIFQCSPPMLEGLRVTKEEAEEAHRMRAGITVQPLFASEGAVSC